MAESKRNIYKVPPIAWLRVAEFMQGWLEKHLGGEVRVKEHRVVSLMHLPEVRDLMRWEALEDFREEKIPHSVALSATRKSCYEAGIIINPQVVEERYGQTEATMRQYIPVEMPKMYVTRHGVLRPWNKDITLTKDQANGILRVIRRIFWEAVEEFAQEYAERHKGEKYSTVDMIEDFCDDNEIPNTCVQAIRREWNRKCKNNTDIQQ